MDDEKSLPHTRWKCKYQIVWTPKQWGGTVVPGGEISGGARQKVEENTNSAECVQVRHPPEEDELGSGDFGKRTRGWIRIIY